MLRSRGSYDDLGWKQTEKPIGKTAATAISGSREKLNKRPGLLGRPHCKGVAIGVARRGPRRSGERTCHSACASLWQIVRLRTILIWHNLHKLASQTTALKVTSFAVQKRDSQRGSAIQKRGFISKTHARGAAPRAARGHWGFVRLLLSLGAPAPSWCLHTVVRSPLVLGAIREQRKTRKSEFRGPNDRA